MGRLFLPNYISIELKASIADRAVMAALVHRAAPQTTRSPSRSTRPTLIFRLPPTVPVDFRFRIERPVSARGAGQGGRKGGAPKLGAPPGTTAGNATHIRP